MTELSIDKETLWERIKYKPHPKQQLFHDSKARFKIPTCGRRFGKSVMAGHEFTANMFIPNTRWWIVGPTYSLGEKEFRVIHDDFFIRLNLGGEKGMKRSYNVEQGSMRIETPWNSILEVKSADKQDSLVGEGLDGVIMSEAALHRKDTWDMYIRPALTDKKGIALFPSTPRGHNWYEGLWRMGQQAEFSEYESWRFPSWANPYVYPGGEQDKEIQDIKKEVSEYHFLQEYAAEFTAFEGKIYTEFKPEVMVAHIPYNPFWKNFQAWDFGFTDPTVVLDIMIDNEERMYIWREYQVSGKTSYENGMAIAGRENPPGYHCDRRYADPRGADEIATIQQILGPMSANNVPWINGIEEMKRRMKIRADGTSGFYIDQSCTETIRQIDNLRAITTKDQKNAKEGQHDYDDHGADAARYFVGEYFYLGFRGNLAGVYGAAHKVTEAETFFQYHSQLLNDTAKVPH